MIYKDVLFKLLKDTIGPGVQVLEPTKDPMIDTKYSPNRNRYLILGDEFNFDLWVNRLRMLILSKTNVKGVSLYNTRRVYIRLRIQEGDSIITILIYKPTTVDPRVLVTRRI